MTDWVVIVGVDPETRSLVVPVDQMLTLGPYREALAQRVAQAESITRGIPCTATELQAP